MPDYKFKHITVSSVPDDGGIEAEDFIQITVMVGPKSGQDKDELASIIMDFLEEKLYGEKVNG